MGILCGKIFSVKGPLKYLLKWELSDLVFAKHNRVAKSSYSFISRFYR